jgi:hypothetical protein
VRPDPGDYAEDKDIPGWRGPRLSKLYRAMTPPEERNKRDWKTTPVFQDISRAACAVLEAACNVRYFEQEQIMEDNTGKILDRWMSVHSIQVKPVARHFDRGRLYRTRFRVFQAMRHMPEDVQRPPRSGDWHGFLQTEIAEGQNRVIVNLDTLEYLNPAKFGQMPTLAGMVTLAPKDRALPILKKAAPEWKQQIVDVAGALFVMLCHPERRGGGDIPVNAEEMGGIDQERGKYA